MGNNQQYIYVQTRLQARHGARPTEQDWRYIESQIELASYLQSARQSCLRFWVVGLHANEHYHVLESTLMQEYHNYIDEVAQWVPVVWRDAVLWVHWLLDLPALQHLLSGNTAPVWMLDDIRLKQFSLNNQELRLQAMQLAGCAAIIAGWHAGLSLLDAWLSHWQKLWHVTSKLQQQAMQKMISLLQAYHARIQSGSMDQVTTVARLNHLHLEVETNLSVLFRRYRYQPAAVFIHLALIALDLERLRSGVMTRRLFPDYREVHV